MELSTDGLVGDTDRLTADLASTKVKPHEFVIERSIHLGGPRLTYRFPNGYGASVVKNAYSYGSEDGLWEVAVLDADGHLTYDTPVTSDVIGYLTDEQVDETLDQIAALPEAVQS